MTDHITIKMDDNQRSFTPTPIGLWPAVCAELVDLGLTVDQYEDQPPKLVHKIALVFQTAEINPETGKRFEPSIEFTIGTEYERGEGIRATFGARSKIRKMLGNWRGKAYTDAESRQPIPLHKLVGVNATLNVLHKTSRSERTYAVIEAINPPIKGTPKLEALDYTRSEHWEFRKKDYAEKVAEFERSHPAPVPAGADMNELPAALQDQDDDLPF